ncbi:MAG: c-type cytochrome [Alphaproteobacteria bacterium]|nr:c-type cytochrome [Alphaproteobacteria bacterium]
MNRPTNSRTGTSIAAALAVFLAGVTMSSPSSAQDEAHKSAERDFQSFCASCHGWGGAGGGPVADVLSVEPPNLTLIAHRNGGTFPAKKVYKTIDGLEMPRAHGNKQMPVWGVWFAYEAIADSLHTGDKTPPPEKIDKRIRGLVAFLKSVQE